MPPGETVLKCPICQRDNVFAQPYPYHAGFSEQGFLYSEAGTLTLVWSSYDPAWERLVGLKHPWMIEPRERSAVEAALLPAPDGTAWGFTNPPRCRFCGEPIERSIADGAIHYYVYPNSVVLDSPGSLGLVQALRSGARQSAD
jgi:hypothetical protein